MAGSKTVKAGLELSMVIDGVIRYFSFIEYQFVSVIDDCSLFISNPNGADPLAIIYLR